MSLIELVFVIGGLVFAVNLLPTILNKDSVIPRSTSISTALVLFGYVCAFIALGQPFSATATGLTAVMWSAIAVIRAPKPWVRPHGKSIKELFAEAKAQDDEKKWARTENLIYSKCPGIKGMSRLGNPGEVSIDGAAGLFKVKSYDYNTRHYLHQVVGEGRTRETISINRVTDILLEDSQ